MWLVKRSHPAPNEEAQQIPDSDAAALRLAYAGTAEEADVCRATDLVKKARLFDYWIACDCRHDEEIYPLIAPAYLTDA